MTRTDSCVVIRCVTESDDGDRTTTFYGPFLPHIGSAVERMLDTLQAEHAERQERGEVGRLTYRFCYVEDVFIGEGESDARVTEWHD